MTTSIRREVAAAFGRHHAIVIAIDDYGDPSLRLRNAVADGRAVARHLEEEHGFEVTLITDVQATLERVSRLIEVELPARVSEGDRLLVYVAGHGTLSLTDAGPMGYLLLHGCIRGDPTTYLRMQDFSERLTALACRHFLLVLDCCFAGAFRWAARRDFGAQQIYREQFERYLRFPAWQVITSAAFDETALDADPRNRADEAGHSPFARAFLDGLAGSADLTHDGVVVATELYLYARSRLDELGAKHRGQTPGLFVFDKHDRGEFLFARPGAAEALTPAPKLDERSNPYRGLSAFGAGDEKLFFGRDRVVRDLVARVKQGPLTVVVGPSGVGKSSLVRAGLLPALAAAGDDALPAMRPGERPLDALHRATAQDARNGADVVLFIDQLEEAITLCTDERQRAGFQAAIADILETRPDLRVLVTVRSDYEPSFARGALARWWRDARYVVPPMTREELREVIEKPAATCVLYFDPPSLVDRLIDEVASMPGALPLLSFTLSELYRLYLRSDGSHRALSEDDYDIVGGVAASVTRRADREIQTLEAADPRYAITARNVMLRMVSVEGGAPTRRRVRRSELTTEVSEEDHRRKRVVDVLLEARLLVASTDNDGGGAIDDSSIEPAHDVLVAGWARMRDWVRDRGAFLPLLGEVRVRAAQWRSHDLRSTWLWSSDPRLPQLDAAAAEADTLLNALERRFVAASRAQRRRRSRTVLGATLASILALAVVAFIAVLQKQSADRNASDARLNANRYQIQTIYSDVQAKEADAQRIEAERQRHFAVSESARAEDEADRAERGEHEAVAQKNRAEDATTLAERRRLTAEVGRARTLTRTGSVLSGAAVAILTARTPRPDPSAEREIWGALLEATLRVPEVAAVILAPDPVRKVSFSPSGALPTLMTVSWQGADLWSMPDGTHLHRLSGGEQLDFAEFSPDGAYIAMGSRDALAIWSSGSGSIVHELRAASSIGSAAFAKNMSRLAFRSGKEVVLHRFPVSAEPIAVLAHEDDARSVDFSPSATLVTASEDGVARIWSQADGALIRVLNGHAGPLHGARFSPDGKLVVTYGKDVAARVWAVNTGELLHVLSHGRSSNSWFDLGVTDALFSSDGKYLTTHADGWLEWSLKDGRRWRTIPAARVVSYRDKSDLVVGRGGQAEIISDGIGGGPGRPEVTLAGHREDVAEIASSSDGALIATASFDPLVRVWRRAKDPTVMVDVMLAWRDELLKVEHRGMTVEVQLGDQVVWNNTRAVDVASSTISSNQRVVAILDKSGIAEFFDAESGRILSATRIETTDPRYVGLSDDGALASLVEGSRVHVVRVRDGGRVHVFEGHAPHVYSAVFTRTQQLVVADGHDLVVWSPRDGRERARVTFPTKPLGVRIWPGGDLYQSTVGDDIVVGEASTGRDLAHLLPGVWGVNPSSDGRSLISGFFAAKTKVAVPDLVIAGCRALRGAQFLPAVTPTELEDVRRECAKRGVTL